MSVDEVWALVKIGCIECGEENEQPVIGVYLKREAAERKLAELRAESVAHDDDYERLGYQRQMHDDPYGFSGPDYQVRIVCVAVTTGSEPLRLPAPGTGK